MNTEKWWGTDHGDLVGRIEKPKTVRKKETPACGLGSGKIIFRGGPKSLNFNLYIEAPVGKWYTNAGANVPPLWSLLL